MTKEIPAFLDVSPIDKPLHLLYTVNIAFLLENKKENLPIMFASFIISLIILLVLVLIIGKRPERAWAVRHTKRQRTKQ